jgi:formylglycine-generating enzyme required for sulfatase activity
MQPAQHTGETWVNPKDGLKYVWIPPGKFLMGCSPGDNECEDKERPAHQVTISKGFWIGQTEVTVEAYRRFSEATGREMPPAPDFNAGWANRNMPIVGVTWEEAQAYCQWVGGRLPTEAEWEYAARAGSTEPRYGPLDEIAWYADNSGRQRLDSKSILEADLANYHRRVTENGNGTHPVGQKLPNGFGLYDTLGNVWEWVNDWQDSTPIPSYYQHSPSSDPTGPPRGGGFGPYRVLRGGSWSNPPGQVRVSFRYGYYPNIRPSFFAGLRCASDVSVTLSSPYLFARAKKIALAAVKLPWALWKKPR